VRACLLSVPGRADNPRVGFVGPNDLLLDAHDAHATALANHMEVKRAYELADALVPADLYGFIRSGRHAWRALELALGFLGAEAGDPALRSPRGERVALHRAEANVRPMLWRDYESTGAAAIDLDGAGIMSTPISYGSRDDRVARVSYSLGAVEDVEYTAVIGKEASRVSDGEAWDYVVGYSELSAATIWQALYLSSVNELHLADNTDLFCEVADAVSVVSHEYTLMPGDVVRTSARQRAMSAAEPGLDIRDVATTELLERLLAADFAT